MKKYEIIKTDYIEYKNRKLFRIKAIRNFSYIRKGELGGYVQNENNLSHAGECWAFDNSKILDNAIVKDNAQICDDVILQDNAIVEDNAFIAGTMSIKDDVIIKGDAQINGNGVIEEKGILIDVIIRN